MHNSHYSDPRTFCTVLMEKSKDSEVIEFLSELEISGDSNDVDTSPKKLRKGAGTFKTDHETARKSLEEYKEASSDELFRNSFFSFNDESPAASAKHGSLFNLEFLEKRFSHLDQKNARQKALSWFSDLFACLGETEGCLTGALVTDSEGYIIDKQCILKESALQLLESLSNKSCSTGKQEPISSDNGINVLGTAMDNIKEFCAVQNNEEVSLKRIVGFPPSSGCSCSYLEKRGATDFTDINPLNEECILSQAPTMFLEGERRSILGSTSPTHPIALSAASEMIDSTQRGLSGRKEVQCTAEEKLAVFEEKYGVEEMTGHNFETIFVKIRLRKMEADLMKERKAKAETQKEYDLLLKRLAELEREGNESKRLINSLKSELPVAAITTSSIEVPPSRSFVPNKRRQKERARQQIINPSDEGVSESSNARQTALEPSKSASAKSNDDHTVVTTTTAQLAQHAQCEKKCTNLQQDVKKQSDGEEVLKLENAELCEEVRCLQTDPTASDDKDFHLETFQEQHETGLKTGSVTTQKQHESGSKIGSVAKRISAVFLRCIVGTLLLFLLTILQWCYDQEKPSEVFFCGNDDVEVIASDCYYPRHVDEVFDS